MVYHMGLFLDLFFLTYAFLTWAVSYMVKKCIEYADNSTTYHSCKTKELRKCANDIEKQLNKAATWLEDTILVFNPSKTKAIDKCYKIIISTILANLK